jgi:hypothetical protein
VIGAYPVFGFCAPPSSGAASHCCYHPLSATYLTRLAAAGPSDGALRPHDASSVAPPGDAPEERIRQPAKCSRERRPPVGTSPQTVRNIRSVEVVKSTATVENGEITEYRVDLKIIFEYEPT